MLEYKNIIANSEEHLQGMLDGYVAAGWSNPSNPTITHWEEKCYEGNGNIRGVNNYTHWTQTVSREADDDQ